MSSKENGKKRSKLRDAIRFIVIALAIGAVVKELRKPKDERTWHGALFDFVPYDFRKPTMDRVKAAMWDPEGSIIKPRIFGVGWGINAGAAVARIKAAKDRATPKAA